MYPSRSRAAEIAKDTVAIIDAGGYDNRHGQFVPLAERVQFACDGTLSYPPDESLPAFAARGCNTVYDTINDTTLVAAQQLIADGYNAVVLNFASARHPGGGFLGGARAQEESLCRSSALYWTINNNAMYRHHANMPGGFYTNYAIYSPAVPVFKNDKGELLVEPYCCAFVTSPAVNVGAIRDNEHRLVRDEMRERVNKVLAIMAAHGHNAAVLGAWGCGVFKNDPELIAELFAKALRGKYAGCFDKVVFAVLSSDGVTIRPFEERFSATVT